MSALPKLYVVPTGPEVVFEIEGAKPLVPDAIYSAVCFRCDVKPVFQTLKVFLRFRISEGPHQGIELFRAYRVKGTITSKGPRPQLRRSGDLFKMLCRVLNLPRNAKPQHVSYREIAGKLCKIQSRTVTRDSKQKLLDESYSVVSEVLSIEAG
ncbi:hypothetical protein AYO46_07515 [Betaproteobacteria bacterium SCGC AG-212-J23]|nr:hypothetical protein AYO46_07515 [Betaproteobacteria bacterium SCGC AG-212-J23]